MPESTRGQTAGSCPCSSKYGAIQVGHGLVDVVPLLQTEQADAEGHEVGPFVALQRHARGGLQALGQEFPAGLDFGVGGVAGRHAIRQATQKQLQAASLS